MKAVILLIDLVEDYFQEGRLKANRCILVSHINALASMGRAAHVPNMLPIFDRERRFMVVILHGIPS
jgi:hypothetical protein